MSLGERQHIGIGVMAVTGTIQGTCASKPASGRIAESGEYGEGEP
jgi:hypothetical protein